MKVFNKNDDQKDTVLALNHEIQRLRAELADRLEDVSDTRIDLDEARERADRLEAKCAALEAENKRAFAMVETHRKERDATRLRARVCEAERDQMRVAANGARMSQGFLRKSANVAESRCAELEERLATMALVLDEYMKKELGFVFSPRFRLESRDVNVTLGQRGHTVDLKFTDLGRHLHDLGPEPQVNVSIANQLVNK